MRIAILSNAQSWHFKDLQRAAGQMHEIAVASYLDLAALISNETSHVNSGGIELNCCDCLIVRAMPMGSLGQVVFRMDALQQLVRQGVCVVNSPKTIEASVDKYLSLALLKAKGVPIPRTGVCQKRADAMVLFEQFESDVVVKPIFGSQGQGLIRINRTAKASEYFRNLESRAEVIYLQEFIDHGGWDLRLLVVGNQVFSISRHRTDHWITNVSCGADAKKHEIRESEHQLAIQAATAVNGLIVGVDLIYDRAGNPFVVDVNAAPGWQAVSQTLKLDVAERMLRAIEQEVEDFKIANPNP